MSTSNDKPAAWSSTAPSGRPWHLRPATGIFDRGTMTFDPSWLPSYPAWDVAWNAVGITTTYGGFTLRPEKEVAKGRDALIEAFRPLLHDLAEQYLLARNDAMTESTTPYDQRSPMENRQSDDCWEYQRRIDEQLVDVLERMLRVGPLDAVLDVLAETTPRSPEAMVVNERRMNRVERARSEDGPTVPLWSKLPSQSVGMAVLQAFVGYKDARKADPVTGARLQVLVQGPSADAFWNGWAQQLRLFDDGMDNTVGYTLANTVAYHLAGLTKSADPLAVKVSARLMERLGVAHRIGASINPWRHFGERVGTYLKRFYPRFDQASDTLFAIAPMPFWLGVRTEVQYASKTGKWISDRVMAHAQANPDDPGVVDLVQSAWLTLDKKQILALEQALPGIGVRHLPALVGTSKVLHIDRPTTQDMIDLNEPAARWALPVFKQAGAPTDRTDFRRWVHEDPARLVNTFLALHSKLEAAQLKKAFSEQDTVPTMKRAAPRSRL